MTEMPLDTKMAEMPATTRTIKLPIVSRMTEMPNANRTTERPSMKSFTISELVILAESLDAPSLINVAMTNCFLLQILGHLLWSDLDLCDPSRIQHLLHSPKGREALYRSIGTVRYLSSTSMASTLLSTAGRGTATRITTTQLLSNPPLTILHGRGRGKRLLFSLGAVLTGSQNTSGRPNDCCPSADNTPLQCGL